MDRTVAIELENSVEIDTVYIPYFPRKPFYTVLDDVCGSCFSVMYIRLTVSRNRILSTVTTGVFRATQFGLVIIFSA